MPLVLPSQIRSAQHDKPLPPIASAPAIPRLSIPVVPVLPVKVVVKVRRNPPAVARQLEGPWTSYSPPPVVMCCHFCGHVVVHEPWCLSLDVAKSGRIVSAFFLGYPLLR